MPKPIKLLAMMPTRSCGTRVLYTSQVKFVCLQAFLAGAETQPNDIDAAERKRLVKVFARWWRDYFR